MKIAVNGGNLNAAITTTTTSGRNSQRLMLNALRMPSIFALASKSPGWPSMKKIASEMAMATDDVSSVSRRCWYRSTPDATAARLAESESGEHVSPKYAPEMIAPAAMAGFNPMFAAIPMKPMPIVPTTVHELPMLIATMAEMAQAVT